MSRQADVIAFACNWDGLSCIEAAAHAGLVYPASVKVIKISCLSRLHLGLILKAFELGAAGVMLLGCEAGECHYDINSKVIIREHQKAQDVLKLLGIDPERLMLALVPRGDGYGFTDRVNSLLSLIGNKANREVTT